MTGKRFRAARSARARATAIALALLGATAGGCRHERPLTRPAAAVDAAVRPGAMAATFARLGRAHLRSTARLGAGPDGTRPDVVATDTDVWIDDRGNWRLVETNDRDGGREVVLSGRELYVALRYGKMIRRPAEDPEPRRLLEEGVGAPWAAWDLLRGYVTVDDFGEETEGGRKVHVYKLASARRPAIPEVAPASTKAPSPAAVAAAAVAPGVDRRAWRSTLVIEELDGVVKLDEASGAPLATKFRARYAFQRPVAAGASAATAMHGSIEVTTAIEEIGASPPIVAPPAEELPLRQRTVPEEKALLGGLRAAGATAARHAPAPGGERTHTAPAEGGHK